MVDQLVLAVTITPVAVTGLLGVLLARVHVQDLSEVAVELAEAFLVLFVEEDALDVAVLVQPLEQFV